jgi:hypothetical protein
MRFILSQDAALIHTEILYKFIQFLKVLGRNVAQIRHATAPPP